MMLKIHFFTQIPLVFGNQQLLLVFLPKKESCESDFGICCVLPDLCPYLLVKVARFPLGTICGLSGAIIQDAMMPTIDSTILLWMDFEVFHSFSVVNRTAMNNFFELKLAKVNFCYLQLQNIN